MSVKVFSPIPRGSGASVVHKALEGHLDNYKLCAYNPKFEFFPFLLPLLCRPEEADIIHTTPDHGCFFAKRKSALVLTAHNFVLDKFMLPHSSLLQRIHYQTDLRLFTKRSIERADEIVCVSEFTANLLLDELSIKRPLKIIHNGVDINKFKPVEKETAQKTIKVLFAGNLTSRKGWNLMPEIAERLDENVTIQYASGLRVKTSRPVSAIFEDLGAVNYKDMPATYQQADILICPTVREGFPLVVLEAMSSGLPVVATNCSSIPELIFEGQGGFLCELGNPADFAEKINFLAKNYELRKKMGRFNRSRVEAHFSENEMLAKYETLFASFGRKS